MKYTIEKLNELRKRDFKVVVSRGSFSLHQTQRNQAKAELLQAIYSDLKDALKDTEFEVYQTAYGPVLDFLNQSVESQIEDLDDEGICSGHVSIQLDAVMKNLDTNAEIDEEAYLLDEKERQAKAAEKERQKKAKTQMDAEIRAEKARRREEEIARIQSSKNN
jgi:hypothetical protein